MGRTVSGWWDSLCGRPSGSSMSRLQREVSGAQTPELCRARRPSRLGCFPAVCLWAGTYPLCASVFSSEHWTWGPREDLVSSYSASTSARGLVLSKCTVNVSPVSCNVDLHACVLLRHTEIPEVESNGCFSRAPLPGLVLSGDAMLQRGRLRPGPVK